MLEGKQETGKYPKNLHERKEKNILLHLAERVGRRTFLASRVDAEKHFIQYYNFVCAYTDSLYFT